MDEVMADAVSKHLQLFNRDFGENLTTADLHGKKISHLRPHLADEIRAYLEDETFFVDLEVMEGSKEVVQELHDHYEIFITTAAMEVPNSFNAKYKWLNEHFPFLSDLNFVFCGDKSIIHADYLIDDNSRHFKHFAGQGLLFTAPHNIYETDYTRVNNWQEVREFFL